MAAGVVVCADVLHSSRDKDEWEGGHASGSGFFVCLENSFTPPSAATILTTTSWLMPLWEARDDGQQSCLDTWIKDNVNFSVIAQRESSDCTRQLPASLLACILLKSVHKTLQSAFPPSEHFDYEPTSSSLPRGPRRTDSLMECLSSLLLLQVEPLTWAAAGGGSGQALRLSPLPPPPLHTGDEVVVQATPLADACPDIFINSMIRGSICGYHGDILILDAPCPVGCEGGVVMRHFNQEGKILQSKNSYSCYDPIAMVIVPVLLKSDSLTGLGLAVSLATVLEAVRDVLCPQDREAGPASSSVSSQGGDSSHLVRCRSVGHVVPHQGSSRLVCGVLSSTSWGTGVVLDEYHVLTCAHVVDGRTNVRVLKQDGHRVEAIVVFTCRAGKSLDVAILQVAAPLSNGVALTDYWSISSGENCCHGDKVTVSGYPLHQPSVHHCTPLQTSGCVSKVHYWEDVPVMYQVTAAVHFGCSGGIVVAMDTGQPIGMVPSVIIDKSTDKTCPHLSFVLPLSFISEHIRAFLRTKEIHHLVAMEAKGEDPIIKQIWRLSIEASLKHVQSKL